MAISDGAALNRWRLVLGKQAEGEMTLSDPRLGRMDDALDFLYGREAGADVRQGGLGATASPVTAAPMAAPTAVSGPSVPRLPRGRPRSRRARRAL